MLTVLVRNWWMLAVRGLAAVAFGLAAFLLPGVTLLALVTVFGVYALVDGIFALVAAFSRESDSRHWWALLFEGIAGIAIGAITFAWPDITAFGLLALIAFWAIMTGVFEIITAFRLRREITGEWLMALGGILSVMFGMLLVIFPVVGTLSVLWLIGSYALFFGVLMIALAFRLRSRHAPGGGAHHIGHAAPSH
ncbi:MAG TPA: HdeD family acid-resistance protein [Blastocatellia bacterium]|nr:HdeD family acid-resistance protein [Blastocatellia bacterium]